MKNNAINNNQSEKKAYLLKISRMAKKRHHVHDLYGEGEKAKKAKNPAEGGGREENSASKYGKGIIYEEGMANENLIFIFRLLKNISGGNIYNIILSWKIYLYTVSNIIYGKNNGSVSRHIRRKWKIYITAYQQAAYEGVLITLSSI